MFSKTREYLWNIFTRRRKNKQELNNWREWFVMLVVVGIN